MRADDRTPSGLRGCGTALVTPFTRAGEVDEAALRRFVQWQLAEGVHFVVPCGSTGEAATLTAAEHRRVVEIVVEEVAGRVPVVAGAGSNDTQRAIALSREIDPAFYARRLDRNSVYVIGARTLLDRADPITRPEQLSTLTALVHRDMTDTFTAWRTAAGLDDIEPLAIDHFDSGQLILEAAAQGLGIAIMHDDHFARAHDDRLAHLFDVEIASPYSYWFVCRPRALDMRAVRLFHDWLVKAGL